MAYVSLLLDILRTSVIVGIIFYILNAYWKWRTFANLINKLPGPRSLPILGNLIQTGALSSAKKYIHLQTVLMQHRRGICKLFSEYGIFRLWIGPYPYVFFHKPESVKVLLNSNVFLDKSANYSFFAPWLGKALFLHNGPKWRPHRRIMTPAFHFRILQDFIPIVNSNAELLVEKLKKMSDELFDGFDIVPIVTMCTLDIFSESSFGVNIKSLEEAKMRYVENRKVLAKVPGIRSNMPWTSPDFLFNISKLAKNYYKSVELVQEFSNKIIKEREGILAENPEEVKGEPEENDDNIYFTEKKKRLHMLDLLLDREKKNLQTRKNTGNEIDNLILAGHDTTQSSLCFTLHLIGSHPEVQEKIHEELDRVFEGDRHRPVTNEDLNKLTYTECVVKESLRLFPTVPIIGRSVTEDIVIDGYTVPKGAQCLLLIQEVHRDPESFPNPERFDPDRFLLENCQNRHPYAYIPFSAGARNCLGIRFAMNEEKIMIAILLRNFQVRSMDPVDKLHLIPELVMSVHSGIRMCFKER